MKSWYEDIRDMHQRFEVDKWIMDNDPFSTRYEELMKLRMRMLSEEFNETLQAYLNSDPEEMIDGLIDLCVIAIGTLDIAGVDADKAWKEVLEANMAKRVGVKSNRPNPLGLPDLVKPDGWVAPSHTENHGYLERILK